MHLSELEGCVLGVICGSEPCTAYYVRKQFKVSLTTNWRASTGAIYPLIAKLTRKGLVTGQSVSGDGRGSRRLASTANGRTALAHWIAHRPGWLADPSADPIRTRFQFLQPGDASGPAILAAWRDDTVAALERVAGRRQEQLATGNAPEAAGLRGAQLQLEARLTWLDELAES